MGSRSSEKQNDLPVIMHLSHIKTRFLTQIMSGFPSVIADMVLKIVAVLFRLYLPRQENLMFINQMLCAGFIQKQYLSFKTTLRNRSLKNEMQRELDNIVLEAKRDNVSKKD